MNRVARIKAAFKRYGTDKLTHNYAMVYAKVPTDITAVLEIGVAEGGSLRAWADVFPNAMVYGLDRQTPRPGIDTRRIKQFQGDAAAFSIDDYDGHEQIFDLIVDDGSHDTADVIAAWNSFHRYCTGLYVIEDIAPGSIAPICEVMRSTGCDVISVLQTGLHGGDMAIVGQFRRVIEW